MLSNYLLGQHRLVLFVDDLGIEKIALSLVDRLLKEQSVDYKIFDAANQFSAESKTSVVLQPISKLELDLSEREITENIQILKLNSNVTQIFLWASTKNIQSPLIVPFLQHMANVVVHITSVKHLTVITKRRHGSVQAKDFQHDLSALNIAVKEIKQKEVAQIKEEAPNIESIGTFKIGEFNKEELEMKKKLKLPFEIMWVEDVWKLAFEFK